MLRIKLIPLLAAAAVMTGVAATPAIAQDGGYRQADLYVDQGDGFARAADPYGYQRSGGHFEDVRYRRYGYRHRDYRRRRCGGTTGAIIGGVAGGLLGREIGRGGRWNEPSTTGLIIGAGAGALAGRAIERENCR